MESWITSGTQLKISLSAIQFKYEKKLPNVSRAKARVDLESQNELATISGEGVMWLDKTNFSGTIKAAEQQLSFQYNRLMP